MPTQTEQIKSLVETNEELENYFRNTIIPQLFVDADLILKKFTPPAMKQFNLHKGDVGKPIADIKDNFRYPTIVEDIKEVIECNEILEKDIQTTDKRWYQMNVIPYVEIKTKKTNGVIITFVETTMRIKDLQEQERLITEHETLLDTISHDIKNPLTSLILSIDLFKTVSHEEPKEFQAVLNIVESSIRKMQTIITDLTDSRKDGHKYEAEEEKLHFENILEDVRLTISQIIRESGASIKTELNVSELTFPRRKLRSIIYNLVSNAIKYKSPDRKPEILITTAKEKEWVVITVKDNGMGIDPGKTDAIFDKYYRVENKIEGTGIGLYLVKEIVTAAGGKIEVESEPGKGSEFKIFLKVA